ncbi:hypothetical protein PkoCFBP13504_19805 [Pseudomonas koreensis]|nr:hypothetical protein PkoCFBP13504_19805 [Pseudomonas koreensis]
MSEKPVTTEAQTLASIAKSGIKIETDTDWPAVGATFIVGVTIAWLASTTQRSQIRSSVANFRHDWQVNLRTKISEFIAKLTLLHAKLSTDPEFLKSPASDELYSEIILLQCSIEMMLDRKKTLSNELTRLMEETIREIKKRDRSRMNELANDLSIKASEVLEQAWQDIRKDLGLKKKQKSWLLSFFQRDQTHP